jgi:uncharacterized membrane protein
MASSSRATSRARPVGADADHGRPRDFPVAAGLLLGLGLGGFFDGIVLHQILQWHHLLSSRGDPATTVESLRFHILWDGLFHALTYGVTGIGLGLLWGAARRPHAPWPGALLVGTLLAGWGLFNLADGLVNHHLLGLHHVNETAPPEQWLWWDLGFLAWGAAMLAAGWLIVRSKRRATPLGSATARNAVE